MQDMTKLVSLFCFIVAMLFHSSFTVFTATLFVTRSVQLISSILQ